MFILAKDFNTSKIMHICAASLLALRMYQYVWRCALRIGLKGDNLTKLQQLKRVVARTALPVIVGGDWQVTPEQFRHEGWDVLLGILRQDTCM